MPDTTDLGPVWLKDYLSLRKAGISLAKEAPDDPVSFDPPQRAHFHFARIHAALDLMDSTSPGHRLLNRLSTARVLIDFTQHHEWRGLFSSKKNADFVKLCPSFGIPMLSEVVMHELSHATLNASRQKLLDQMASIADFGVISLIDEGIAWARTTLYARHLARNGDTGPWRYHCLANRTLADVMIKSESAGITDQDTLSRKLTLAWIQKSPMRFHSSYEPAYLQEAQTMNLAFTPMTLTNQQLADMVRDEQGHSFLDAVDFRHSAILGQWAHIHSARDLERVKETALLTGTFLSNLRLIKSHLTVLEDEIAGAGKWRDLPAGADYRAVRDAIASGRFRSNLQEMIFRANNPEIRFGQSIVSDILARCHRLIAKEPDLEAHLLPPALPKPYPPAKISGSGVVSGIFSFLKLQSYGTGSAPAARPQG